MLPANTKITPPATGQASLKEKGKEESKLMKQTVCIAISILSTTAIKNTRKSSLANRPTSSNQITSPQLEWQERRKRNRTLALPSTANQSLLFHPSISSPRAKKSSAFRQTTRTTIDNSKTRERQHHRSYHSTLSPVGFFR